MSYLPNYLQICLSSYGLVIKLITILYECSQLILLNRQDLLLWTFLLLIVIFKEVCETLCIVFQLNIMIVWILHLYFTVHLLRIGILNYRHTMSLPQHFLFEFILEHPPINIF